MQHGALFREGTTQTVSVAAGLLRNASPRGRKRWARWTALLPLALLAAAPAWAQPPHYVHHKVAVSGDPAPDTGGTYVGFGFVPVVNAAEEVAFYGQYDSLAGIFVDFLGAEKAVALTGDAAPGTGGGTYSTITFLPSLDDDGNVVFRAEVTGGTAGNGIFRDAAGTDVAVALEGDAAPATGTGKYAGLGLNAKRTPVDASPRVAFYAAVSGASVSEGIFLDSGGTDTAIALPGSLAPGTGGSGTYSFLLTEPDMNANGDVAFQAGLSGASASEGIFVRTSSGTYYVAALAGDPAPGTGGGTYLDLVNNAFAINDARKVPFVASVTGGTASEGIFLDAGGPDTALVLAGDPAPGTGGGTYSSFDVYPAINNDDFVVFRAVIVGGSTSAGIFVVDASGNDAAVALRGQTAPVAGAPTYDFLGWPTINDSGVIAFSASLLGGAGGSGVFKAVPSPSVPLMQPEGIALLVLLLVGSAAVLLRYGPVRAGSPAGSGRSRGSRRP